MDTTTKSRKRRHDDQDPPPFPPKDSYQSKKKRHDFDLVNDVPIPDDMHILDSEDTDTAHLLKIETRPDWLKPVPIGKSKLSKADLEGPAFKIDLLNPEGNLVVPDVNKPLPLGGPPERRNALSISKLKAAFYQDFRLEELVPSMWIESEREYDISATYGISHYVVNLKTTSRYDYTFLREIVLRRADYKEYKISEVDFKNLHPNDFEDLNIVIRKRVEDLQLSIESYQTKLNLTELSWDATDFLFKEDYTIVSKPRAVNLRSIGILKGRDEGFLSLKCTVHDGTLTMNSRKAIHMVKRLLVVSLTMVSLTL
ncbi:hypothetical protein Tco_0392995 [Tanacetum coccineum]